jgi:hypothetical protein
MVALLPPVIVVATSDPILLAAVPWWSWLVLLAWPLVMLLLGAIARRVYWSWYKRNQAFLQVGVVPAAVVY